MEAKGNKRKLNTKDKNEQKHSKNGSSVLQRRLKLKEYVTRDSILTSKLKEIPDCQIIYNMFLAILISLLINTAITDYLTLGKINLGQNIIRLAFNNVHLLAVMWLICNSFVLFIYGAFLFWAKVRSTSFPKTVWLWDRIWIFLLCTYYVCAFLFVQKAVYYCELAPGSAMVLLTEHVRLMMKQHSFIRENVPRVLEYKPHSDKKLKLPKLGNLAYFIMAPCLIYRDSYPRTKEINWKFALKNLGEIFAIILFFSLLIERFLKVTYSDFCISEFTWKDIVLTILSNLLAGIMFILCGFYAILHASQNAFAEVLRFGDRQFYQEWWATTSLAKWFRTWNILVQDWLFVYVYKEFTQNKSLALFQVFLISGVVHEWIISVALNLFLPVQFTQFVVVSVLLGMIGWMDKNIGNIAVWYCLALGPSIQISLYSIEFFARHNCPLQNPSVLDFFKPRFLTCNCTTL